VQQLTAEESDGASVVVHPGTPIVVEVHGEIDLAVSETLKAEIDRHIDGRTGCDVIFDLSGVEFMDSSGLAIVVATNRDHRVRVRSASVAARRVIELVGLADAFELDAED
jgi:stage II sporulation protein AA (anti-sigma F factor antagonist)